MKTILVVDGNNLSFKIYQSFKEGSKSAGLLRNSVGVPTTVIYGLLRILNAFTDKHSVDSVIICWDIKGGSKFRKGVYKHYKGNREYKDMSDYFEELEAARSYLKVLGFNQAPMEGIEADDVIGFTSTYLSKKGNKVIIFSDDKDYFQLLKKDNSISIYRPCVNKMKFYDELMDDYVDWGSKFKPEYLARIAGFVGQPKDNIPGAMDLNEENIPIKFGFGEAKVKSFLPLADWKFGKAFKMLASEKPPISEKLASQVVRNKNNILLSYELMRIRTRYSDYSKKELKRLKEVCSIATKKIIVNAQVVTKLIRDLEIKAIRPIPILKKLGIHIEGDVSSLKLRKIKVGSKMKKDERNNQTVKAFGTKAKDTKTGKDIKVKIKNSRNK